MDKLATDKFNEDGEGEMHPDVQQRLFSIFVECILCEVETQQRYGSDMHQQ